VGIIQGIRKDMGRDLEGKQKISMSLVSDLLQKIDELCFANKLRFAFIADQFNAVYSKGLDKVLPFSSFIELQKIFQNRSGMVILSGSANNEFNFNLKDFWMVDFNEDVTEWGEEVKAVTLGFTEEEFEVWADHFKEDLGDEDFSDLYVTNLIPLDGHHEMGSH